MKSNDKSKPLPLKLQAVTVDPGMAIDWLAMNAGNRPISKSRVEQLMEEMAAGRFYLTPDAIAFDSEGRLLNGQHRLTAIRDSGYPCPLLVVRGLVPDTRNVIDTGRRRGPADTLHFHHGIAKAKDVTAICTVLGYVSGNTYHRAATVGAILDLYHEWEKEIAWVLSVMGPHRRFYTNSSLLAGLVVGRRNHPEQTDEFFDNVKEPSMLLENQAAVWRLIALGMKQGGGKHNRVGFFYKVCAALAGYIQRDPRAQLKATPKGYLFLIQGHQPGAN